MTPFERRALLKTQPNPDPRSDYVAALETALNIDGRTGTVLLRYVPDREILLAESFRDFMAAARLDAGGPLEHLTTLILADVNDRLVPRWIQVEARLRDEGPGGVSHAVLAEERQPKWDNAALLSRLKEA